ncbi:uncharacterized protein LOC127259506 isoform X2 [Andrographis paniculata]|uniref:uncharacterized protein LOC127259506 isoform X2 n=1 Tax=Andrographis paniculata TaxID=175694 RepID=UPI0021E769F2|nr:uncharacterized protein LOC127259506 isoform X2 [Andrographis paniculata]
MEDVGGGATRLHHPRASRSSDRFLGIVGPQPLSAASPVELSEQDIFNTPSGSSPPSPTYSGSRSPNSTRSAPQTHRRGQYGILAALNDNLRARSGSGYGIRPVFNHKASTSASLSSSSSNSPATTSATSRMMIPRRHPPPPPVDRTRLRHQSAPVNVPVMPPAMMRRARDLENVLSEKEGEDDEEEKTNGVILPPHEMLAARYSPILSSSVLEGAGRTLKGRDLRQLKSCHEFHLLKSLALALVYMSYL